MPARRGVTGRRIYLAGESAGQCGPCKVGLPAIARSLAALVDGSGGIEALDVARRSAAGVTGRGACSHPDGMTRFVLSALDVFTEDLAAHVFHSSCGRPVRGILPLPTGPEQEGGSVWWWTGRAVTDTGCALTWYRR